MGRGANGLAGQAKSRKLPLNPAEKQASPLVTVVIGVNDVAAVGCHPTRELPHQPGLVGADHLENGSGGRHGSSEINLSMTDGHLLIREKTANSTAYGALQTEQRMES